MQIVILFSVMESKIPKEFVIFLKRCCKYHLGNKVIGIKIHAKGLWDIVESTD